MTASTAPRVLFLFSDVEDYLADSLFHGLRTVLGANVVDYPKREFAYDTFPASKRAEIRGQGFSLYGLLEDIEIDRHQAVDRARRGEFDLVVISDIWRSHGRFAELVDQVKPRHLVIVDGSDWPTLYPYAKRLFLSRGRFGPRPYPRHPYFKRELTPATAASRYYYILPGRVADLAWRSRAIYPISFSIPAEKLATGFGSRPQLMATHVVDSQLAAILGRSGTGYVFECEQDYYNDLRQSRFAVTTKRSGWDCLRHYEIAASGAIPCFRGLARKPPRCAPHGLTDTNCVSYDSPAALLARLEDMSEDQEQDLREGIMSWAKANTTQARALEFLDRLKHDGALQ